MSYSTLEFESNRPGISTFGLFAQNKSIPLRISLNVSISEMNFIESTYYFPGRIYLHTVSCFASW